MRLRHRLNARNIAIITRPGVHADGGGLYLRIRPNGSRAWIYIYRFLGKRREMRLGSDQDVSLARARLLAAEARALVFAKIDPLVHRAAEKVVAKPAITFGEFAMDCLDSVEDGFRNPKHRQQWRNTLQTYAAPLFPLPITDVTTEAVLEVLKPIWLSKAETASRVRGRIERILDAAKVKDLRSGENPARGRGHLDLLLPKRGKVEVKHHAALPFKDVAAFMVQLRQRPALAARALEFTILTAARSGETRGMTWGEIDFAERLWTIPGERMKARAEHQVPLTGAALAVLAAVKPEKAPPGALVFPSTTSRKLSDMALSQLLKRMGQDTITVHGFRSTFRDWAGETTQFGREEIEMALAHTVESATERAYRRGRALPKRRELMAAWEAYCRGESGEATGLNDLPTNA